MWARTVLEGTYALWEVLESLWMLRDGQPYMSMSSFN